MRYDDQRSWMVNKHLIPRKIDNKKLLEAFYKVPRHLYVPDRFRRFAYEDYPLDIGHGQTISQPYMVAYMLDLLNIENSDKVLEIGTGSGYQTAILAELAAEIYTVERIPELMITARNILDEQGYKNIYYRVGDRTKGWEKAYPPTQEFDKIVVSAASPSVPQSLINQLAERGLLVIPAGARRSQDLILIEKRNGETIETRHGGCTFVPLIGSEGWDAE
ncbi:MAG: protein-L-isoaspartate(D-aspartate) O-methyltransferase [Candidatus Cloacimonadia bacterium]